MDKLSSILPASPRVKSVDLADAKPRRPGAPAFGAPIGSTSSARDRVSIKGQEVPAEPAVYKNPKDMRSAKMVEQITKNFFDNRLKTIDSAKTIPHSQEVADSVEAADLEAPSADPNAETVAEAVDSSQNEVPASKSSKQTLQ